MNILVTGGAGGIGSTLIKKLISQGYNVFCFDNLSGGYIKNIEDSNLPKSNFFKGDIRDEGSINEVVKQMNITHIIHLAAITSLAECEQNRMRCFEVNVLGTENVLKAALSNGCKVVFASTSAVYENNLATPFLEGDFVFPDLAYSMSKKHAEEICLSYFRNYGLPVTILRYFNVFGPRQDIHRPAPPLVNYITKCLKNGESPVLHSTGEQKRDYIHVDDVCECTTQAMLSGSGSGEIFNVCSGEVLSVKDIFEIAKASLNSSLEAVYRDGSKIWSNFSVPIKSERLEKEVDKFSLGGNKKITNVLNVKIRTDIKALLADTVKSIEL